MPTPSNLRQDNFLTNLAAGYKQSEQFIGQYLFPTVPVNLRSGSFVKYYKETLIDQSGIAVTGRNAIPNAIDFDLTSATYSLIDYALATQISTIEKEENNIIKDLQVRKNALLFEGHSLLHEKAVATMAQLNTNYDATNLNTLDNSGVGKYKWNHASADPLANLDAAQDAIRTDIGLLPDTFWIGWAAARQLSKVTQIQTLSASGAAVTPVVTPMRAVETVCQYLGISKYYIGMGQYTTSATGTLTDLWSDNCGLAYVGNAADSYSQKLGVTLQRKGYPLVFSGEVPRSDGLDEIRMRHCWGLQAVNWDAAYLIEDCV